MNVDFDGAPPPTGYPVYPDIVRIVDDPTDQMLNSVNDDGAHFPVSFPPSARPARHPAPACPAAQAAALAQQPWQPFLAGDFFFGLVASVVGPPSAAANAALNTSSLLGLGAATFNRP